MPEIFVLNKLEGMKYAEIAEMMNLSENTVRNHIALAVKKIAETPQRPSALISFSDLLTRMVPGRNPCPSLGLPVSLEHGPR